MIMRRKMILQGLRGLSAVLMGAALLTVSLPAGADDGLVLIGNAPLKGVNTEMIRRIYSGRVVEIDGTALRPVNLAPGNALRQRFLDAVLQQSDADYVAYWTVRRYIGKGTPPTELRSSAEVIDFVGRTPGALGYIDPAELRPGLHVLWRR
jgi:hypothetical protein